LKEDPVLKLIVEVRGSDGESVEELEADDVRVELHKTASRLDSVEDFVASGEPFATLLLIDTSCSMAGAMSDVRQAARDYVAGMKGGDVAIVAQFNDRVTGLDSQWGSESAALESQIDSLTAAGTSTHFYEALNRSLDKIVGDYDGPGLRSILILTDGIDELSPEHYTLDRVRGLAHEHEVPISTVHYLPNKRTPRSQREKGLEVLEMLSRDSGGVHSQASSSEDIARQFKEIQNTIHKLWVLTVSVAPMLAGANPQLKIEVGNQSATAVLAVEASWSGEDVGLAPLGKRTILLLLVVVALLLVTAGIVFVIVTRSRAARTAERQQLEAQAAAARSAAEEAIASARKAQVRIDEVESEGQRAIEQAKQEAQASSEAARTAALQAAVPSATPAKTPRRTMFWGGGGGEGCFFHFEEGTIGSLELFSDPDLSIVRVGSDPSRVDLLVQHETVSGHHVNLSRDTAGTVLIEDMGSSNGTYVDGVDIRGRGAVTIMVGQQVQFGLLKSTYSS